MLFSDRLCSAFNFNKKNASDFFVSLQVGTISGLTVAVSISSSSYQNLLQLHVFYINYIFRRTLESFVNETPQPGLLQWIKIFSHFYVFSTDDWLILPFHCRKMATCCNFADSLFRVTLVNSSTQPMILHEKVNIGSFLWSKWNSWHVSIEWNIRINRKKDSDPLKD